MFWAFVSDSVDGGDEKEWGKKKNTEKINPTSQFSILRPEQITSAPVQEWTSEKKRFSQLLHHQQHKPIRLTFYFLLKDAFFRSQAQMI